MQKKLIALDLDGTLLYDWYTLKDETRDYLIDMQAKGHTVVIATGRPFRSSDHFYDALQLKTPLINFNGGIITSKHDPNFPDQHIWLDKDAVLDIFKENRALITNAFCEIKDNVYLLEDDKALYPFLHLNEYSTLTVGPFEKTLPGPTNGFIALAEKGNGDKIEAYIEAHYQDIILSRNWGNDETDVIEIFTPKTNKGEALAGVASYLGFAQADTLAFGDGHNDIEMLKWAGIGVAMANAHPAAKAAADIVSEKTNQEFAIEYHLDQLIKKGA